jgi:hypothetical protein
MALSQDSSGARQFTFHLPVSTISLHAPRGATRNLRLVSDRKFHKIFHFSASTIGRERKLNLFSLVLSVPGQQHKVQCTESQMKVLVAMAEPDTRVYLEGLNGYKSEKCEPKIEENLAVFELSLINFYDCGIIRVVNKLTVSGRGSL